MSRQEELNQLKKEVGMLNVSYTELLRQYIVIGSDLSEQQSKIVELYRKIDDMQNGDENKT